MNNRIKELKQVEWRKIKPLQPNNAKVVANHNAIENSLKRYGFAKPFYGWEFEGEIYTLDGHQRKEVLSNMLNVPETLPCVLIDAKDRKEAMEMLIEVHNQNQNPFDIEVLQEWIEVEELDVDIETINVKIDSDVLETEPSYEDLIGDEKNKPATLKITFESPEQLQKAEIDIQELLDRKYQGAYFSVSAGQI